MIINTKNVKKILITAIIITIIATAIFLFIKYGITIRQLEKQEIAEQIEKLGYYRADYHINKQRELLQHKYNLLMAIPMFLTLMVIIPPLMMCIFNIFENKEN